MLLAGPRRCSCESCSKVSASYSANSLGALSDTTSSFFISFPVNTLVVCTISVRPNMQKQLPMRGAGNYSLPDFVDGGQTARWDPEGWCWADVNISFFLSEFWLYSRIPFRHMSQIVLTYELCWAAGFSSISGLLTSRYSLHCYFCNPVPFCCLIDLGNIREIWSVLTDEISFG